MKAVVIVIFGFLAVSAIADDGGRSKYQPQYGGYQGPRRYRRPSQDYRYDDQTYQQDQYGNYPYREDDATRSGDSYRDASGTYNKQRSNNRRQYTEQSEAILVEGSNRDTEKKVEYTRYNTGGQGGYYRKEHDSQFQEYNTTNYKKTEDQSSRVTGAQNRSGNRRQNKRRRTRRPNTTPNNRPSRINEGSSDTAYDKGSGNQNEKKQPQSTTGTKWYTGQSQKSQAEESGTAKEKKVRNNYLGGQRDYNEEKRDSEWQEYNITNYERSDELDSSRKSRRKTQTGLGDDNENTQTTESTTRRTRRPNKDRPNTTPDNVTTGNNPNTEYDNGSGNQNVKKQPESDNGSPSNDNNDGSYGPGKRGRGQSTSSAAASGAATTSDGGGQGSSAAASSAAASSKDGGKGGSGKESSAAASSAAAASSSGKDGSGSSSAAGSSAAASGSDGSSAASSSAAASSASGDKGGSGSSAATSSAASSGTTPAPSKGSSGIKGFDLTGNSSQNELVQLFTTIVNNFVQILSGSNKDINFGSVCNSIQSVDWNNVILTFPEYFTSLSSLQNPIAPESLEVFTVWLKKASSGISELLASYGSGGSFDPIQILHILFGNEDAFNAFASSFAPIFSAWGIPLGFPGGAPSAPGGAPSAPGF